MKARLGLGFRRKISLGAYLQGLRNSLIVTSFVVDCLIKNFDFARTFVFAGKFQPSSAGENAGQ